MDKEYLVQQLSEIAARYNVPADREALGELVAISSFRVIAQGSLIASIGDGTGYSGLRYYQRLCRGRLTLHGRGPVRLR